MDMQLAPAQIQQHERYKAQKNPNKIRQYMAIIAILMIIVVLYFLNYQCLENILQSKQRVLASFTTSSNRTQNSQKYCSSRMVYEASEIQTASGYRDTLSSLFKSNSTQKAKNIYDLNYNEYFGQSSLISSYVIYVGPYVIGFLIILSISPCLLCCCICPNHCPLCCRKSQQQGYTRAQLLIPVIILVIMMLIAIGVSIPGMTFAYKPIQPSICAFSILIDDVLNGNVTNDGQYFFSGYKTIVDQLGYLQSNLTNIKTEINKLNLNPASVMSDSVSYATAALNSISLMPNGVNTNSLSHSYTTPLVDDTATTGSLSSLIANQIGIYTNSNSYTGSMYNAVKSVKDELQIITNSSTRIIPQLDVLNIGKDVQQTTKIIQPIISQIQSFQKQLSTYFDKGTILDDYLYYFLIAFYSAILALSVFNLIALIMMKCFQIIGCRFCMYFACFGLIFLCFIGFLMAILLSSTLPSLYFVCQAFDQGLSSQDQTQQVLNYFGASSEQAQYFRVCISGNGDILSKIYPSLDDSFTDLQNVVFKLPGVDFSTATSTMTQIISTVSTAIDKYGSGQAFDFSASSTLGAQQIANLNKIANKSFYTSSCPSGSYTALYSDVWVPSVSSQSVQYVSCLGKQSVTTSDCNPMTGCPSSRCLGLFDFLKTYTTTASITTDLNTKYGTCNDFNNDLVSYYNRYVDSANSIIGTSASDSSNSSKLAGRFHTSKTGIQTYSNHLSGSVKPLFEQISGNLSQKVDSITNSETGLLKGLNCKLIGQDVITLKNSICVGVFSTLFLQLILMGIATFSLAFGICLTVCVGVQHWKDHEMAGSRKVFNLMEQQSITINKNDFSFSVLRSKRQS